MDPKALGAESAHPYASISEMVQVMPTQHAGLTKREDIAKAALAGLLASGSDDVQTAAKAVSHADRLLAELAKDRAS